MAGLKLEPKLLAMNMILFRDILQFAWIRMNSHEFAWIRMNSHDVCLKIWPVDDSVMVANLQEN